MAFESSLMLLVINELQMEYEIGPHPLGGIFSELNEAALAKFSATLVLVQKRSLDPFLHT